MLLLFYKFDSAHLTAVHRKAQVLGVLSACDFLLTAGVAAVHAVWGTAMPDAVAALLCLQALHAFTWSVSFLCAAGKLPSVTYLLFCFILYFCAFFFDMVAFAVRVVLATAATTDLVYQWLGFLLVTLLAVVDLVTCFYAASLLGSVRSQMRHVQLLTEERGKQLNYPVGFSQDLWKVPRELAEAQGMLRVMATTDFWLTVALAIMLTVGLSVSPLYNYASLLQLAHVVIWAWGFAVAEGMQNPRTLLLYRIALGADMALGLGSVGWRAYLTSLCHMPHSALDCVVLAPVSWFMCVLSLGLVAISALASVSMARLVSSVEPATRRTSVMLERYWNPRSEPLYADPRDAADAYYEGILPKSDGGAASEEFAETGGGQPEAEEEEEETAEGEEEEEEQGEEEEEEEKEEEEEEDTSLSETVEKKVAIMGEGGVQKEGAVNASSKLVHRSRLVSAKLKT
jgi:hypothetical protein